METPTVSAPLFPAERRCPFDPPAEYGRLLAEQPVSRVTLVTGRQAWLVTRHADVRTVLGDNRFSADVTRPGFPFVVRRPQQPLLLGRTFIRMDPPEHTRYRRMLTKEFTVRRMEALRPRIQEIVDGFLDDMARRTPPVDLVQALALPVPSLVICLLLGVPYADHEFFQHHSAVLLRRTSTSEEVRRSAEELLAYLDRLITQKERDPGDDLLSRLVVEQEQPGRLSHEDLVAMAVLLLIAGHETTANMIGLGALALLRHPDQLNALRENPSLVDGAIEELLRYLTIVHNGLPRVALEDVEIGGQLIRAGEGVIALLPTANRDPATFEKADTLDIRRDARGHVAFGHGVHQCLGQALARVELQVVFASLFRRFPTLRLAVPVEELPLRHDMLIYGVHELPVTW